MQHDRPALLHPRLAAHRAARSRNRARVVVLVIARNAEPPRDEDRDWFEPPRRLNNQNAVAFVGIAILAGLFGALCIAAIVVWFA